MPINDNSPYIDSNLSWNARGYVAWGLASSQMWLFRQFKTASLVKRDSSVKRMWRGNSGLSTHWCRSHAQKMARGAKSAGANVWTFWRWYGWSCSLCKTRHMLVRGSFKAWGMVRVLVDGISSLCWRKFSSKLRVRFVHGTPPSA